MALMGRRRCGRGSGCTAFFREATLRTRSCPRDIAASLVPPLRIDGLRTVGVYSDAQTNDARLCLANISASAWNGAAVANYAEVVSIERGGRGPTTRVEVIDGLSGERCEVDARTVVNAAGPWLDHVRRLGDESAGTSVTLSKGVHLVLEAPQGWHAALTIPIDRSRVSFALPWEGTLLLGTTDEMYSGDPAEVGVTEADEIQVLAEAGRALDPEILAPDRIIARIAGLRVLPAAGGRTSAVRRETRVARERSGMFTVAGGKLTTYRRIAAAALEAMRPELGLRTVSPSTAPLPGAVDPRIQAEAILRSHPELDAGTAGMLSRTYGSLSTEVLALTDTEQALIEPLAAGVDVLAAQVVYARDYEWAVTAEDVLRRRTTLSLSGGDSAEVRDRVGELLSYGVVTAPGSS